MAVCSAENTNSSCSSGVGVAAAWVAAAPCPTASICGDVVGSSIEDVDAAPPVEESVAALTGVLVELSGRYGAFAAFASAPSYPSEGLIGFHLRA